MARDALSTAQVEGVLLGKGERLSSVGCRERGGCVRLCGVDRAVVGAYGQALTVEGPQVVVAQVHQVLQGGVELFHDALDPEGKGRGVSGAGRNGDQKQVAGPPDQGTPGPSEKPPEPRGAPWADPAPTPTLMGPRS